MYTEISQVPLFDADNIFPQTLAFSWANFKPSEAGNIYQVL